jgi:hypothetical protein
VSDERDDPVALGDVLFKLLDQGARSLLEVLLYPHLAADGTQVACKRVAARLELRRNGGEKDPHVKPTSTHEDSSSASVARVEMLA